MFMVTCQEAAFTQHFQLRKMAWIVGFLNPEDSWKKSNPLLHNVQMFYIDMIDKGDIYRFIVTYRVISYIFTFVQPPCSWSPPEFYSHLITHGKLVSTHHRMWGWGWDHTFTLELPPTQEKKNHHQDDIPFLVPSWELTYPIKNHFWRWFSFSPGGICIHSLEAIPTVFICHGLLS